MRGFRTELSRLGLAALLALVLAVAGSGADAKPRAAVGYTYYPVSGVTASEMLQQMELHGPNVDGSDAYASTESVLQHTGSLIQTSKGCSLKGYQITIDFTIRLPAAQDQAAMPARLKGAWRTFYQFVKRHEETHKTIWLQCANKLEQRIKAIRERSCQSLEQRISTIVDSEVAVCQRKHSAFDRAERARLHAQPLVKLAFKGQ